MTTSPKLFHFQSRDSKMAASKLAFLPVSAAPLLCCVQLAMILSAHKIECFITLYCQHVCSPFPASQCYFWCFRIEHGCPLILHKPQMLSTVLIRDIESDIWLFVVRGKLACQESPESLDSKVTRYLSWLLSPLLLNCFIANECDLIIY